jgi:hypothetical protein
MNALVVGTFTAVRQEDSGASMRLRQLEQILLQAGFDVSVCDKNGAKRLLDNNVYSLIVLSSYSCASLGRKARKSSKVLWFDPFDSWLTSRCTRIYNGEYTQILALIRDFFWIFMFPSREIVTFISESDASMHKHFSRNDKSFILPIEFGLFDLRKSQKVRLVFIGDGNYGPNREALLVLDKIAKSLNVRVTIIGKDFPRDPLFSHFDYLGYLPREELFQTSDILLAPGITGAGIKTKVALPLSMGLRVIATSHSGNGILDLPNLWKVTSVGEFLDVTKEVMEDNSWEYSGPLENIYSKNEVTHLRDYLFEIKSTFKL